MSPTHSLESDFTQRQAHIGIWAITSLAAIVFVAFVVAFGHHGDRLTHGIDIACSDAALQWGKRHEELGNIEQAIRYYRQALAGHFRAANEMYECAISLGNILCRQQLYQQALDAYTLVPEEAYTTAGSLTGYVTSLRLSNRLNEAERLGRTWLTKARNEKDQTQALWAHAALGDIYQATHEPHQALSHFAEAAAIDPTSPAALHAARILHQLGRSKQAIEQINAFLHHVKAGRLHHDATRLRREIELSLP